MKRIPGEDIERCAEMLAKQLNKRFGYDVIEVVSPTADELNTILELCVMLDCESKNRLGDPSPRSSKLGDELNAIGLMSQGQA